jgi:hypothetical protein
VPTFNCRGCGNDVNEKKSDPYNRDICKACLERENGEIFAKDGTKYDTVAMLPRFIDENLVVSDGTPIVYLSAAERERYRIHVRGGMFLNRFYLPIISGGKRETIFVMDPNGHFYLCKDPDESFRHSSFFAGRRVGAPGNLRLKWAKLTFIGKRSGHYGPEDRIADQAIDRLKAKGVKFIQDSEGNWLPEIGWRGLRLIID